MNKCVLKVLLATGLVTGSVEEARAQCEIQKLIASDATDGTGFGSAVAVSGTVALIYRAGDHDLAFAAGGVYVFELQSGAWAEATKLAGSDITSRAEFGYSVAVSGDTAVAGAWGMDDIDPLSGDCNSGAVYVFARGEIAWPATESAKLTASDATCEDWFGYSVALDGDTLVVGAPLGGDAGPLSGAAYVFEWDGSDWCETARLTPLDAAPEAWFGVAVAISGGTVAIGAYEDDALGQDAGAAYVFERRGPTWVQTAKLTGADTVAGDRLGRAVAVFADVVLVGAPSDDHALGADAGSAYVFERKGAAWVESQKLLGSDLDRLHNFGTSVAVWGDTAVVGTDCDHSAAYVFKRVTGPFVQTAKLAASDYPSLGQCFGGALSLNGETLLAGAWDDDEIALCTGAAYVFQLPSFATAYCFGAGCPCSNDDSVAGCATSTGAGALLTACASGSVTADDLVLTASGLPPGQNGIFYMGAGQLELPFGDGLRCVGAGGTGIFRYFPVLGSGPDGVIMLGPGIVAHSQASFPPAGRIAAGDTWNFQAWFRDPAGPCGSFFNLSNAVGVSFAP